MPLLFALLLCPPLIIAGIVLMFKVSAMIRAISKSVTGYDSPYGWTEDGRRPYTFVDYEKFISDYVAKTGDLKTVRRFYKYQIAAVLLVVIPGLTLISQLTAHLGGPR